MWWLAPLLSLTFSAVDLSVLNVPVVHAEEKVWTVEEMKSLATDIAKAHKLNVDRFLKTVECESHWDRFAVGDKGLSHGLVQLYHPTRDWNLATSSAYDPEIALMTMADSWVNDEQWRWSCWRNLYGKTSSDKKSK